MTPNTRAKRLFTAIEHGLIGATLCAITLFVHTETYKDEVAMERERMGRLRAQYIQDCSCKREIVGRQLVASICQSPTNLGPWFHECLYEKEKGQ